MSAAQRYLVGVSAVIAASIPVAGCTGPVPPASAAMLRAAAAAYNRGDDAAASERLAKFLAVHPAAEEAGEAYYLRGLVGYRAGQWDEAQADFYRAIELTRREDLRGHAHLALAFGAERRGDDAAARADYLTALEALQIRSAPCEKALFGLGALLQRHGEWLEADRYFDRLAYLFGDSDEAAAASRRIRARAWTFQVGTFDRRDAARRRADRLRAAGLPARVAATDAGAVRFVVQVGRHQSYDEALKAAAAADDELSAEAITTARD